jgi:thymidylate synthase (FAD)
MLKVLETSGRTCYKSEDAITDASVPKFVEKLSKVYKHESVIEHQSVTVKFICDRGVTHELVRHRLAAYSQESTRYCNYGCAKFGNEVTFIRPPFWDKQDFEYILWQEAMDFAEKQYLRLLEKGASPQQARSVLPNSLKTEIVMTANLREWKHVFKLRCNSKAHPQMVQSMTPVFEVFKMVLPELYSDIEF